MWKDAISKLEEKVCKQEQKSSKIVSISFCKKEVFAKVEVEKIAHVAQIEQLEAQVLKLE
jgi:hypothetical protein